MAMTLTEWFLVHALGVAFWLWLLLLGGAERIVGWGAWGLLGWFAGHWTAEQIRLYALILLVIEVAWFVTGLVFPAARFAA